MRFVVGKHGEGSCPMTKRGEAIWLQGQLRPHARLIALGLVVAVAVGSIGTLDPLLMR